MSEELKPKFQFTGDPGSTLLYLGDVFVAHIRGRARVELQKLLNSEQQQAARIAELNRTLSIEEARSNELTERLKLYSQEIATRQEMPPLRERVKELEAELSCCRESLNRESQLACDLRSSQDEIIERCAKAVEDWPESAARLRRHCGGSGDESTAVSGEDFGAMRRERDSLKDSIDALSDCFPEGSAHRHAEITGVSLLDDLKDLLRECYSLKQQFTEKSALCERLKETAKAALDTFTKEGQGPATCRKLLTELLQRAEGKV